VELEVVRAAYYGLKDATIGLNKQIDALVIDQIGDLVPPHCAFYNYVDHPWVARRKVNREEIESTRILCPAMVVYLEAAPTIQAELMTGDHRDGDFPLSYGYLSIEADEAKRMRDALYTTRALFRFFTQFHSNMYAALRNRNNVHLYVAKDPITPYTPMDSWEAAFLAAATTVTYQVREHLP
jgi:hypothetical protein